METIYITYSNASGSPHVIPEYADHIAIHYIDANDNHRVIEALRNPLILTFVMNQ